MGRSRAYPAPCHYATDDKEGRLESSPKRHDIGVWMYWTASWRCCEGVCPMGLETIFPSRG